MLFTTLEQNKITNSNNKLLKIKPEIKIKIFANKSK